MQLPVTARLPRAWVTRAALISGLIAVGLPLSAQAADASISVKVRHRILTVKGSQGNDRLALRVAGSSLAVDVGDNGSADFQVAKSAFDRLRVKARGGDDKVRIDSSVTVPARVQGQGGQDAMTFNGANINERMELSANGPRARFTRDVGNIVMDLDGVERVDVAALGGSDTLTVGDLRPTDVRTVNEDLGGDAAPDQLIVNGSAAGDAIVAAGSNGSVQVTGLAPAVNAAHANPADDSLTLNGLGGDDTLTANTLAATAIRVTEDGGVGNDTLAGSQGPDRQIGGDGNDALDGNQADDVAFLGAGDDRFTWDPGDGSDIVEGQAGSDRMRFNGANTGELFAADANGGRVRFIRNLGNIVMDLDDVEGIDLAALGGSDVLTLGDLSGTDVTEMNADLAADGVLDRVIVNGTQGDDVIDAAGSAGSLSVLGLATRLNLAGAQPATDQLAINALGGDDVVNASGLDGDVVALSASGGDGDDILIGGAGPDSLFGDAGDDVLIGGAGQDTLDGGPGDNVVIQ